MSKFKTMQVQHIDLADNELRNSKVHLSDISELAPGWWTENDPQQQEVESLAAAIRDSRRNGCPVVFFLAGHVVKHGLSRYIIDLIKDGVITHVACNGSVMIHDWELAFDGHTSEDVAATIKDGRFGNWKTPSQINNALTYMAASDRTIGEILGDSVQRAPHKDISIINACHTAGIPFTSHLLVGGDIINQHPNCTASVFGVSYRDFLTLGHTIQNLEGGTFVNIGSQVTGTEVFLKLLSMARNIAPKIDVPPPLHITTAMLDFVQLPADWRNGEASEGEAAYYYRPWKSLLLRTVADGGKSFYLGGPHVQTVPALWTAIKYLVEK